jgi:hypothetical protein
MCKIEDLKVYKIKKLYKIGTFLLILFFQIILNSNEIVPRSLPDEIGAMATAAKIAGHDWSYVLSQANMYYGFGTTLLMFPVFVFIKNPLIIYQILLGWGALIRTLPIIICFKILDRVNIKNNFISLLISIIAIIGAPTRATNIDNEPMLILGGWCLFYLLIILQDNMSWRCRCKYSIVLAITLTFSLTVHTRAYIYILAIVMVVVFYQVVYRKSLINYWAFGTLLIAGMLITSLCKNWVQKNIYTSEIYAGGALKNTWASTSGTVINTVNNILFTEEGVRSFFVLIMSNLWIVFVYYAGIVIIISVIVISSFIKNYILMKKDNRNISDLNFMIFPTFFAIIVFGVSLGGLAITWINAPIAVWNDNKEITRGFFYLRYIGNTFGPILFTGCIYLYKRELNRKYIIGTIIVASMIEKYILCSVILVANSNGKTRGDWFGYFAPLSGTNLKWSEARQNAFYYCVATFIAIIILAIVYALNRCKKMNIGIGILAILLLYEYGYSVINWDGPFSHSNNYYGVINEIHEVHLNTDFFDDVDIVYYVDDVWGRQFVVQFELFDKQIISDLPTENKKNMIVLLSDIDNLNKYGFTEWNDYYCVKLDDNEYIITNNYEKKEKLCSMGYLIIDYTEIG